MVRARRQTHHLSTRFIYFFYGLILWLLVPIGMIWIISCLSFLLTILVPVRLLHHAPLHILSLHGLVELRAVELMVLLELLRD